jgi:1-phosphofructokinase family hexose kinase
LKVLPEHIQAFLKEYEDALQDAAAVLIGGSLPAGVPLDFYPQIIRLAREKNLPVVFDASGEELRRGVEARPTVIKPNRDELKQLVPGDYSTTEAVYQAACSLRDRIGCSVVVTLGSEGALAVSKPASYWIPAIKVRTVSAAGAGDGVLAGITAALSRGEPFENGLRLGFAAATAVLLTPATADCRKADVERFYPEIRLIPYP